MPQVEIPREKWQSFCDLFTRQHQGWIVNLSVSAEEIAEATAAEDAEKAMHPLAGTTVFRGITAEPHGSDYTVMMNVGVPPNDMTHFIYDPARLFCHETEEGLHEGLMVQSIGGQMALLRFRAPALPEILDGISPAEAASTSHKP